MKKLFVLLLLLFGSLAGHSQTVPDTVSVGFYINSIHDINFKDKEYTLNLWLWLTYKNPDFDFSKYLEVPMAKEVDKSFYTVDTLEDSRIYMLMKLQCLMKDSWKIQNFPFDRQKLRFSIENSQYGSEDLIFREDTVGKHYSKWVISGWKVIPDSFKISTAIKKYETSFGDPSLKIPRAEFSAFKIHIGIERDSWWIFFKLFIGMYISFLLSYLCFFIHTDNIDSRFSLSVGSLFAVIGNKYVVDSALPESTSYTLVDTLHGVTLCFVFLTVACSVYILKLNKNNQPEKIKRFNTLASWILMLLYVCVNLWFIGKAYYSTAGY